MQRCSRDDEPLTNLMTKPATSVMNSQPVFCPSFLETSRVRGTVSGCYFVATPHQLRDAMNVRLQSKWYGDQDGPHRYYSFWQWPGLSAYFLQCWTQASAVVQISLFTKTPAIRLKVGILPNADGNMSWSSCFYHSCFSVPWGVSPNYCLRFCK